MLFFASFSSGLLALILGFIALLALVGMYSVLIWPLTFWDLATLGIEKYAAWTEMIVLSVFSGGALAGYWMFSGERFKVKSTSTSPRLAARSSR
jgi:hypothetical protein